MCSGDCQCSGRSRLEGREVVTEIVCDDCERVIKEIERTSLSPEPIYTHPPEEEQWHS